MITEPTIAQQGFPTATEEADVTTAREIQDELRPAGRRLRAAIPEVYAGYAALQTAAMGDGAGRATCMSQPAADNCRAIRSSAWSEPPRSATGWTESTVGGLG